MDNKNTDLVKVTFVQERKVFDDKVVGRRLLNQTELAAMNGVRRIDLDGIKYYLTKRRHFDVTDKVLIIYVEEYDD